MEEWLCKIFSLFIAWNLSTLLRVTQTKADDLNLINSSVFKMFFYSLNISYVSMMYIDHIHLLPPLQLFPVPLLHLLSSCVFSFILWLLINLSPVTPAHKRMGVCPSNIPAATSPKESDSLSSHQLQVAPLIGVGPFPIPGAVQTPYLLWYDAYCSYLMSRSPHPTALLPSRWLFLSGVPWAFGGWWRGPIYSGALGVIYLQHCDQIEDSINSSRRKFFNQG